MNMGTEPHAIAVVVRHGLGNMFSAAGAVIFTNEA